MKIGIDILDMGVFNSSLKSGGREFLNSHFHEPEIKGSSLAGKFAAKEAVFKTGIMENMDFLSIQILIINGRPVACGMDSTPIKGLDISISHAGNTVVAVALFDDLD